SLHLSLSLSPPPPRSTLFPYTTLFRSQSRRRYRKRSECQEFVRQPSGRWHGSRSTGEPSPRPWQRRRPRSNVPTAPLRGKDKRPQARQPAPDFQPRSKVGQRSCVSETSLTRSCLRPTARAAIIESESAFHNDVGWSTASSPAIRAWLKRLALATEPSTPWKSGASAPRWQRSVLGFQPCTGPEGHLSCAPECGPKRAALPHRLCCSSWPLSSRLLEQARFDEQASVGRTPPSTSHLCGDSRPRLSQAAMRRKNKAQARHG